MIEIKVDIAAGQSLQSMAGVCLSNIEAKVLNWSSAVRTNNRD